MAVSPAHVTLVPDVVTTVDLDSKYRGVTLIKRDAADEVWYTLDGTTPAANTNGQNVLPTGICRAKHGFGRPTTVQVKLLSTGDPRVTIVGG